MRPPCLLPPSAEKKLARQLDQAATKTEYRRVLGVWLRASLGMSAAEIATALGCSVGTVHDLHPSTGAKATPPWSCVNVAADIGNC